MIDAKGYTAVIELDMTWFSKSKLGNILMMSYCRLQDGVEVATGPGKTVFSWKWQDCCGKGQTDDLYLN